VTVAVITDSWNVITSSLTKSMH